ncbi:MAG TPA: hypothetical protein VKM55_12470 [Candidatus Lokiarchaeia archaeon]|nr:hypothetical protein [Candidatus Lokiarchaeia archaeon]
MTIEIDDAGTGDPLLGAVIGFYRRETDQLHFEWIPLDAYQAPRYYKELPQEECAKAVMRGLLAMNIKEDEVVMICSGSIFDKARQALDDANITHEPLKVEGKLQDAVEEEYVAAIERLGIHSKGLRFPTEEKDRGYKKRYFILLNWARKNPQGREQYVKNGLNFWQYSKDQQKPIPGGWKKARKDFEDKLEAILRNNGGNGNGNGLTWDKLRNILKNSFSAENVWISPYVTPDPGGVQNIKENQSAMRMQLYNNVLSQIYVFIGKKFNETPGDAVWKAIMWKEDEHAVNGIIFYVAKDEQYRQNLKWLNFLRPLIPKLLGSHMRFAYKPF